VFTALISWLTSGTPPANDCHPIANARTQDPGPSSFWLTFESLDCQNPEGFLAGLAGSAAVDEPLIKVNKKKVWGPTDVTCPSHPKVRLEIEPIELKPEKNTIELWDSDIGGWSRDDLLGTAQIDSEAGRYECRFEERFARYVVTWVVTRGKPE
jgi:hypothetical protein